MRASAWLAVVVAGTAAAVVPLTSAGATGCAVSWGSGAKAAVNDAHAGLTAVRTGRHECFDRLVLDLSRSGEGYRVRYVDAVRAQGSGAVVPLRGGAYLQVDDQSMARSRPAMPGTSGFATFRDVKWGGSFEGYSTVGLGVRGRLPFRVFRSGDHLVVDVAHRW